MPGLIAEVGLTRKQIHEASAVWRSFRYVTEATGTGTLPEVRKRNAIGRYYRTILHHVMLGAHLNQNNVCNLSHHRLTRPIDDVR